MWSSAPDPRTPSELNALKTEHPACFPVAVAAHERGPGDAYQPGEGGARRHRQVAASGPEKPISRVLTLADLRFQAGRW